MRKLLDLTYAIRANYWVIPAGMTIGAIVLALILVSVSVPLLSNLPIIGTIYTYDANTARQILGTIGGAMITVVSIVFSLTVVSLTLASQQYGPRTLENFLRDDSVKFVLGTFTATFAYSLVVLTVVTEVRVPYLAVLVAVLLGFNAIGVLIYFINHFATSIRGEYIVERVVQDMQVLVLHVYPEGAGQDAPPDFTPPLFQQGIEHRLFATDTGYLQKVYVEDMVALAQRHDLVIRVEKYPGEFVLHGSPIATIVKYHTLPNAHLDAELLNLFDIGRARTVEQDLKLLFDKLVETAVRSMSPAINDPITAMLCLDRLAEGLRLLAKRPQPSPYRMDDSGVLRLIVYRPVTFEWMTDIAFTEIRRYAKSDLVVLKHMLKLMGMLAVQVEHPSEQKALQKHATLIMSQARVSGDYLPEELEDIERRYAETIHYCSLRGQPSSRKWATGTPEQDLIATE
jgi:uncharacterized membrane protein